LLFDFDWVKNSFVQVNWKTDSQQPILFGRKAQWSGIEILHRRLLSGELIEDAAQAHELNISLAGNVIIEKHTTGGNKQITRGTRGIICFITAGQPVRASWNDNFECLTINLKPSFVQQIALENRFTPRFELTVLSKRKTR